MTLQDIGALLLLSAMWGGSFLFMRVGAPEFGPILLIFLRVGIAASALLGYAALSRKIAPLGDKWRRFLVVGVINSALPFVLISSAELLLPASVAGILNATTPLFGALAASVWLGERLTAKKVGGLLVGFAGVVVMVGLLPMELTWMNLAAVAAVLLATVSYGIAAVYTKRALPGAQPLALSAYSQMFAAAVLLPLVPFAWPDRMPSPAAIWSVLGLSLLSTAVAYLIYFRLILRVGPTRATMVTYLSPAFSMLWGALLLSEHLGMGNFVGFGLILSSVLIVSRQ